MASMYIDHASDITNALEDISIERPVEEWNRRADDMRGHVAQVVGRSNGVMHDIGVETFDAERDPKGYYAILECHFPRFTAIAKFSSHRERSMGLGTLARALNVGFFGEAPESRTTFQVALRDPV